jgi:tetratricopeptide (TPR) repeat protein
MAEHRSYLPSVGIFIFAATLLCALPLPSVLSAVIALTMTGALAAATVQRCTVWGSPQSLWKDVCDKSPRKSRPWLNLGAAYFDAGKLEEAEAAFIQSIKISPTIPAFANLACVNLHRKLPERAYEFARMGLPFRPSGYDHLLLINLGDACRMLNKKDEAIAAYHEALQRFPERLDIRLRLCNSLLESRNPAAALEFLRAATALHPHTAELREAIAQVERQMQQFKLQMGP